jgi:hypothetical protein
MKGLLLIFSLSFVLFLTGCSNIQRMNANMEESIQTVTNNTNTVQHSSEVIQKNTEEIAHSTTIMSYFPLILIVIVAVLFYPSFVLIKLQRKLLHDIRSLIKRLKK